LHVDGLWRELAARGYTALSSANVARLMAHVSRWLEAQRMKPSELTEPQVERFLRHRRRAGYTQWLSPQGLEPILSYLRDACVVPPKPVPRIGVTAIDTMVTRYMQYVRQERAVTKTTANFYERIAREYLAGCGDPPRATAANVNSYVVEAARECGVGFAKLKVSALRSLLRYLHVHGDIAVDLAAAVPPVAGWRLSSLPKALRPDEVGQLLTGCDRRTHLGRRAYAVLLVMVRLGLRAGEVASLELDDLDWRNGELLIRGKGNQLDRLPLPVDVGTALAAYVRRSRPKAASRRVFLRVHAPVSGLSSGGVASIVRAACERAGLAAVGGHRLRHTAATEMLRGGASLSDIAQVLRHRHVDTTANYAKVDRLALRTLAQPWPGGEA
jgi:site-specific recombinase XerD